MSLDFYRRRLEVDFALALVNQEAYETSNFIDLASVCVEPKGTHLPDRKALGKLKCAVSVRLLPAA